MDFRRFSWIWIDFIDLHWFALIFIRFRGFGKPPKPFSSIFIDLHRFLMIVIIFYRFSWIWETSKAKMLLPDSPAPLAAICTGSQDVLRTLPPLWQSFAREASLYDKYFSIWRPPRLHKSMIRLAFSIAIFIVHPAFSIAWLPSLCQPIMGRQLL